jgi:hypothetical protein
MAKIVIIGGGWAGCAAALAVKNAGGEAVLLEKNPYLFGTGLVGGIMRNNGRYTAAEEMIAMGAGELFEICDENSVHVGVDFPGHVHANLYNINKVSKIIEEKIRGIAIVYSRTRIVEVGKNADVIQWVVSEEGDKFFGDAFIDATGTSGPVENCVKYGNGCVNCIIKCPEFGERVSIVKLAGAKEKIGTNPSGGYGAMSGSCKIKKSSLSRDLIEEISKCGFVVVPLPLQLQRKEISLRKVCQQYALPEYTESLVLLDTGEIKLMLPYMPIKDLRSIPGFEESEYIEPKNASRGNSMRYFAIPNRDNFLRVMNLANLFCAGEKTGMLGHTEAIVSGTLAAWNAVLFVQGKELKEIPLETASGDIIDFVRQKIEEGNLLEKYTFSGGEYFSRMREKGLYLEDRNLIREKIRKLKLENYFRK